MSTLRACLMVTVLLLTGTAAAQSDMHRTASATDYFNQAAKQYVKEDKTTALKTLDKALREHPGDARLLKLAEELLKDEGQQQQEQDQQEQKNEGQQDKEQENKEGDRKDKEEEQQDKQDGGERKEEQRPGERKPEPGRISPQDAKRILDALERQEKDTQTKVQEKLRPVQRVPIEKDW